MKEASTFEETSSNKKTIHPLKTEFKLAELHFIFMHLAKAYDILSKLT